MSENEGESRSVGAFLLGFLTGVLVCLGVGGGIFMGVQGQRAAIMREEAMRAEMEARAAHDAMKATAESERRARLKAEEVSRKNAEKDKDKQK